MFRADSHPCPPSLAPVPMAGTDGWFAQSEGDTAQSTEHTGTERLGTTPMPFALLLLPLPDGLAPSYTSRWRGTLSVLRSSADSGHQAGAWPLSEHLCIHLGFSVLTALTAWVLVRASWAPTNLLPGLPAIPTLVSTPRARRLCFLPSHRPSARDHPSAGKSSILFHIPTPPSGVKTRGNLPAMVSHFPQPAPPLA